MAVSSSTGKDGSILISGKYFVQADSFRLLARACQAINKRKEEEEEGREGKTSSVEAKQYTMYHHNTTASLVKRSTGSKAYGSQYFTRNPSALSAFLLVFWAACAGCVCSLAG